MRWYATTKKTSKYDPIFLPQPYTITNIDHNANKVTLQLNGQTLIRHPDDIKLYLKDVSNHNDATHLKEGVSFEMSEPMYDDESGFIFGDFNTQTIAPPEVLHEQQTLAPNGEQGLRRSERIQMQNIMHELNNGGQ